MIVSPQMVGLVFCFSKMARDPECPSDRQPDRSQQSRINPVVTSWDPL